jgi:hypothetical protein
MSIQLYLLYCILYNLSGSEYKIANDASFSNGIRFAF